MKKIWVVQYNDGTADVWDDGRGQAVQHTAPAWPYVDAFAAESRIAELEAEIESLKAQLPKVVRPKKLFSDAGEMQYICACGYPVDHHRCGQCGAIIDWSEEVKK